MPQPRCNLLPQPTHQYKQGKPWQFKAFPFKGAAKGDMVDTFNHVFGAFLHYSDEEVRACACVLQDASMCAEAWRLCG